MTPIPSNPPKLVRTSFPPDMELLPPVHGSGRADHDYRALRTRISHAVHKVCPGWLRDHHDDLVQQGILKVHQRYDGQPVNSTLLYRVAHSVIVDEIRRHKRRQEIAMTPTTPERVAGPANKTPEAVIRGAMTGEGIQSCLGKLSEDRRRAVTLYLLGHTVPQVGEQLGFSAKKAENLVYRGLKDLRGHLEASGLTP